MNKSALKTFATSTRKELLKKVEAKAMKIGITEDNIKKADIESSDAIYIDGKQLSKEEKVQRDKLIARINQIGFKQVMEEVAYTWFNRFTALRFMEVNDYIPTGVRVLSSSNPNSADPDMLNEALELDLEIKIEREYIFELKLNNRTEELFKYLIIKHCNDLNRYLPFMFETIDDYTEILFPEGLLARDSFIRKMTDTEVISESDWEEVEIIGWMYQYYNTELNELVYDGNMSKSRIPKELLPAATQLFTPDWAVKYMVENSIGELWLDGHLDTNLKGNWKYYLDNVEEPNEKSFLKYSQINPEEIKILDPCMGSGHILVYAFDVLMNIYESCGYIPRDATKLILQKNLYGLEIEDRAYQLACFSLIMKARKYNRRIFDEKIELNLCSISESNEISDINLKDIINLDENDIETANYLIDIFKDAKEYGSILNIEMRDYYSLFRSLTDSENQEIRDLFQGQLLAELKEIMPKLIKQAQIMTQKYDVVITNPPYLGNSRMSVSLNDYVKKNFPNTKTDLSMVMYQKAVDSYSKSGGYVSFITTNSWMSLKSFEEIRKKIIEELQICSLVDFGTELFDGKVGHNPIVSWVNKKSTPESKMVAIRLVEFNYSKRDQKEVEYFNLENRYYPNQQSFIKLPGNPIAYWVSSNVLKLYNSRLIGEEYDLKEGVGTRNDAVFLKYFWEVSNNNIGRDKRWILTDKAGAYRKWYMGSIYVMDWEDNGRRIKNYRNPDGSLKSRPQNTQYLFREGVTWGKVGFGKPSFRWRPNGYGFNDAAPTIFGEESIYLLGQLNSNLFESLLKIQGETLNITTGVVKNLPNLITDRIDKNTLKEIIDSCIRISVIDWNNNETSYDFKRHSLLAFQSEESKIETAFLNYLSFTKGQFNQLKEYEEYINKMFINASELQQEIKPEIDDRDITISVAEPKNEVKTFISYVVGCIFGRYSLDEEGLIFAGGEFNSDKYQTFNVDKDNILPILPGAYFEDDIASRFIEFVKVTFGAETLSENLDFIAETLGKNREETAIETIRRYFLNDFFKDHVQIYKKRPIYWLFTSGKQKAFNCLIYMHRYDKTTLSRIRIDYLHEYQIRLDVEKKDLLSIIEGDYTKKEISNAKKELKLLDKKIEELKEYDELLHHLADTQIEIDLDDGVAVNYEKFKGLVAKI
ncbi:BREX-1 system adenine-specific DNA-methyltransferase PglX [Bacillus mycoides]|uniref:BREX-1 system adenine-specific DNA-methyltransferase PglX n=1 Tax=Bacillus mycoides TaxID=1405 RepID=UPI003D302A6A